MAAGTNWKRPWEGQGHAESLPPSYCRTARPQGSPITAHQAYARNLRPHEHIPAASSNVRMPSSAYRPGSKGSDGQPGLESHLPLSTAHKRQRLETLSDRHSGEIQSPTPRTLSNSFGLRLEGLRDPSPIDTSQHAPLATTEFSAGRQAEGHIAQMEQELYRSRRPPSQSLCPTCSDLELVQRVVTGLNKLHEALFAAVNGEPLVGPGAMGARFLDEEHRRRRREDETLDQGLDKLDASIDMLRDLKISPPRPSLLGEPAMAPDVKPLAAYHATEGGRGRSDREERFATELTHQSPPTSDDGLRSMDGQLSATGVADDLRRSFPRDPTSHVAFSPHPYISGNNITSFNRLLPSPSSLNFSAASINLPPMSPSLLQSKSPHTAHLQELQHQLSTKSLAYQILQGEHEKLLAAFSRSQTRCATLDRKSQVSDEEINNLAEDRMRLQTQVEAFEAQIEALQQGKEEALKQSVSSGSQYMKIMSMSSRLQEQGAAELKKWKQDREIWQKEKDQLLVKMAALEADGGGRLRTHAEGGLMFLPPTAGGGLEGFGRGGELDLLRSASVDVLREEVVRLRAKNREVESSLQCWLEDSAQMDKMLVGLREVGERMRKRRMGASGEVVGGQD